MGNETDISLTLAPGVRIIDEDETHATVAVRIEKAWLSGNVHVLLALLDCAVQPLLRSGLALFAAFPALYLALHGLAYGLPPLDLALDSYPYEISALLFVDQ